VEAERLVRAGYEQVAERYESWSKRVDQAPREHYLGVLGDRVTPGGRILELGCGTGLATRVLVRHGDVIAVDFSRACLLRSRQSAPIAKYLLADITQLAFRPGSFDAVACFYSLIHVPREKHRQVLESVASWLRPGGTLVATMGCHDLPNKVEQDWMGAPMFWSFYDTATNIELLRTARLTVVEATEVNQEDEDKSFSLLRIVATRD
jgi:SAM-dependent methyltransferase